MGTYAFIVALLLGGCGSLPGSGETGASRGRGEGRIPADVRAVESEVTSRVNAYRQRQGLPLLAHDDYLANLAREHSVLMATGRRKLGHGGFEARAEQIQEQLVARSVSENVAYNNYPANLAAEQVTEGWVASPGHHANLTGPFTRAGVGAARSGDGRWYVTQLYALVR